MGKRKQRIKFASQREKEREYLRLQVTSENMRKRVLVAQNGKATNFAEDGSWH